MAYRKFTLAQKQEILKEAAENGMLPTARKYEVSQSLIYKWKEKAAEGTLRETGHSFTPDPVQAQLFKLQAELIEYKQLLAERDLEIRIKDALIKKVQQREQKA
jgi:transposase-like protein